MTSNSSQQRKPYDGAPYASLRNGQGPDAKVPNDRNPEASELAAEGTKLKALREALWAAFEAGPDAGLPNTLIDLTMAYTGALRLQLNLKALMTRQRKVQPAPRPGPSSLNE